MTNKVSIYLITYKNFIFLKNNQTSFSQQKFRQF